jgi:dsDNA-binding SOS-regulon protein
MSKEQERPDAWMVISHTTNERKVFLSKKEADAFFIKVVEPVLHKNVNITVRPLFLDKEKS